MDFGDLKKLQKMLPSASWCPQVASGLSVRADGLLPCCEFDGAAVPVQTVEQYKRSQLYQDLVKHGKRGTWHQGCKKCKFREDAGQHSQRTSEVILHLASFLDRPATQDDYNPKFFKKMEKRNQFMWMNIQPTNKCNQACVMCQPDSSSKLQEEVDEHGSNHWMKQNANKHVYNDIVDICSHRHPQGRIYLSGGEPTIMRETLKYLETIEHPYRVSLALNSNFQTYNEKFWNVAKKFNSVHILASIDGIGKRNEYQRGLSIFSQVEENILRTRDFLGDKQRIDINPCWTILNSMYASEIGDWAEKHDFNVDAFNVSWRPPYFSISKLHPDWQDVIVKQFQHKKFKNDYNELETFVKNSEFDQNNFKILLQVLDKIKKVRNQDYADYYPKLHEYIEDIKERYAYVVL